VPEDGIRGKGGRGSGVGKSRNGRSMESSQRWPDRAGASAEGGTVGPGSHCELTRTEGPPNFEVGVKNQLLRKTGRIMTRRGKQEGEERDLRTGNDTMVGLFQGLAQKVKRGPSFSKKGGGDLSNGGGREKSAAAVFESELPPGQ